MGPRGTADQKDRASPQSQLRLGGRASANLRHRVPANRTIPPVTLRAKPQVRRAREYLRCAAKLVETAACSGRSRIYPPDRLTQVDHRYRPPDGQPKKRDAQR